MVGILGIDVSERTEMIKRSVAELAELNLQRAYYFKRNPQEDRAAYDKADICPICQSEIINDRCLC